MMSCTVSMDTAYTTTYSDVNTHMENLLTHSSEMAFSDVIKGMVNRAIDNSGGEKTVTSIAREIGMKQPTLLRIMNGDSKNPRRENLAPIARYFKCDVDDFYAGSLPPDLGVAPQAGTENPSSSLTIEGRMDMLEEMILAGARKLGIDAAVIVSGDMEEMRQRVRAAISGEAPPSRSERDERGLGQPTPSGPVRFVPAQVGVVNAWNGAERRHG